MRNFFIIAGVIILSFALSSCGNENNDSEGKVSTNGLTEVVNEKLSVEMEVEIKEEFLNFYIDPYNSEATIENVALLFYYGEYNGSYVVRLLRTDCHYIAVMCEEVIDGIKIRYSCGRKILVWNEGKLYELKDAYEKNIITKADLIKIS